MEAFYKDGLRFSCTRCSACCRHEPGLVELSQEDLSRLAGWAGMAEGQFVEAYCRWVWTSDKGTVLCLREKSNYDCVFWRGGCVAYEARPVQCRTYPFWSYVLEDGASWNAERERCPGIDCGALHGADEIESRLAQYRARIPVRKEG